MMPGIVPLASVALLMAFASSAEALNGKLIDKTGAPVVGATISVVGLPGSATTDIEGHFVWKPDPVAPFTMIVVLSGGRVAKPIVIDKFDSATTLSLTIDAAIAEEMTVVAGVAPSIETTPGAATTLVSSRDIGLRMPGNLMQAIEHVPGVNQVSEGQAAVPAVRSMARGRTLILIDGGRVNSERRVGPSATFMDPSVIDGIDIARGPGSVAYGSDSFGGVISVRTVRPVHSGLQARVGATVGTGIPDRRFDFLVTRGFGTGGILVAAHGRDVEDYDGPDAEILNSGYGDRGALVRVEQKIADGLLSFGWQGDFGRDIERPRNNSNAVRFYYPFENSHRITGSFTRANVGGLSLFELSGFFGTFEQRTDQDRIPTATRARDIVRADMSASDLQFRVNAERVVGRGKLEFGADVNGRVGLEAHDVIVLFNLAGAQTSLTDNLSIDSARRIDSGVFFQGQSPLGRFTSVAGGVRFDRVGNVNKGGFFGDRSVSNGAVAGFGSISVGPFSHVTLTAQVARGFRDPTLSDRFFRGPSGRGFITGNPDLDPESSLQTDVSARYSTNRVMLAVYGYNYQIKNLVERFPTAEPESFAFRNRGRARVRGFEAEAQASIGAGFWVEVGAQIGRGRALDDNANIDDVAPDTVSFGVRKAVTATLLAFVRLARYADDDRPGPSEIAAPGHTNLDFGASWMPTRRFELRGIVRNALNDEYFASPDPRFVLAPGINAALSVVVKY
jgi:outer membrane receptor protein involved in Fe transport